MYFGITVFVLAVTILFQTATLIRSNAEISLVDSDKLTYYEYYEGTEAEVDANGNRIVTLEDIIPTLYRYSTESLAITIVDQSSSNPGNIVTRFDRQTETLCTNWNGRTKAQKELILNEIKYVLHEYKIEEGIMSETEITKELEKFNLNELEKLFKIIYKQDKTIYHPKTMDCPWNGKDALTAQRIDSDLSGTTAYFKSGSPGIQGSASDERAENHIPCLSEGIINKYKNDKFTEYLVPYDTNKYIESDEDKLMIAGELINPVKREIVYVRKS